MSSHITGNLITSSKKTPVASLYSPSSSKAHGGKRPTVFSQSSKPMLISTLPGKVQAGGLSELPSVSLETGT